MFQTCLPVKDGSNALSSVTSWRASSRVEEKTALGNTNAALSRNIQNLLNKKNSLHWRVQEAEAQLRNLQEQEAGGESALESCV